MAGNGPNGKIDKFEGFREPDGNFKKGNPGGPGRGVGKSDGIRQVRKIFGDKAQKMIDNGMLDEFFDALLNVDDPDPVKRLDKRRAATGWMLEFFKPYLVQLELKGDEPRIGPAVQYRVYLGGPIEGSVKKVTSKIIDPKELPDDRPDGTS